MAEKIFDFPFNLFCNFFQIIIPKNGIINLRLWFANRIFKLF